MKILLLTFLLILLCISSAWAFNHGNPYYADRTVIYGSCGETIIINNYDGSRCHPHHGDPCRNVYVYDYGYYPYPYSHSGYSFDFSYGHSKHKGQKHHHGNKHHRGHNRHRGYSGYSFGISGFSVGR